MLKKLLYWKYQLLSKITTGKIKLHYKNKKSILKKQLFYKQYDVLIDLLHKLEDYQSYQKFYILFKQRFNIDIPADVCGEGNFFELVHISLKDLRWWSPKIPLQSLVKCPQYQYLKTRDEKIYLDYLNFLKKIGQMTEKTEMLSLNRFQKLEKTINQEGYRPEKSIIVINQDNVIRDGLHRSCILLYKYGENYKIPVVQVSRKLP